MDVDALNASLLPVAHGFLLLLERHALHAAFRMSGLGRLVTYDLAGVVLAIGLFTGFRALTAPAGEHGDDPVARQIAESTA